MNAKSIIGAACAALAITTAIPAAAHDPGDVVTPHFERAIPNIPGKTLTALIVDYPPGGGLDPAQACRLVFHLRLRPLRRNRVEGE